MIEYPAQGHLRHVQAGRNMAGDLLREVDAGGEFKPGKGLADIELLAVAIEVAMIVRLEGSGMRHLATQQATRQRQPHDNAYPELPGPWQQGVQRLLAEDVEDDLQRAQAFLLQTDQAFFNAFHAGAETTDQTVVAQLAQPVENPAILEHRWRHAMQLRQV